MTQQPAVGRPQKDIRLKVGADNYEKQVSDVSFSAKPGEVWQGGTPDAKLTDEEYELNITYVQAWDEPDSFTRWAFKNKGKQVDIEWQPHADDPFTLTATITIPATGGGGKVGKRNETTIACPSTEPVEKVVSGGAGG